MTAIVGILCKDGVVVATDSSATFSSGPVRTIEQKTKKLVVLKDAVIVAGTGQVGLGQRFCGIVETAYDNKVFTKPHLEVGRILSQETNNNFASSQSPRSQYGALLAYSSGGKFHLCEFALTDFQPEWKTDSMWFVSMGCGQPITDPFLGLMRRVFWGDALPTVADATFVATWTLQHAIHLNTGGINGPIQMAVLRKSPGTERIQAHLFDDNDIQEHLNNVEEAEKHLAKYKDIFLGKTGVAIPQK